MSILKTITTCLEIAGRLCATALCLMLIFPSPAAGVVDRTGDAFLTGFVASILERELRWEKNSYSLKVVKGVAKITLFEENPLRQEAAGNLLRTIEGLHGTAVVVKPADSDPVEGISRWMGITGEGEAFPTGDLFRPLIANPKQPQFLAGVNHFESSGVQYTRASVGFGETFGLYRFFGSRAENELQMNVDGALFAQFNMDTPSSNLINADYTIGFPVTYRYGDNSFRLRIYHQSSHLGDEFLQSINPPERINLSYESIELIYSREWRGWRGYGGGEYLLHKEPENLKPMGARLGIEYRGGKPLVWTGRPIAGVDTKSWEENNWSIDTSLKAGLEFGHPNPGQRRLRLMAEWYNGYDPHGQFYNNKIEYYGLGLSLGF